MAYARTSEELSAALDELVDEDDEYPTIAPGWATPFDMVFSTWTLRRSATVVPAR